MEKHVYKLLTEFDFSQKAALCSQLDHHGSVPRKDYPVMLVPEHGQPLGTVGGGSLEHSVIETARTVLKNEQPRFLSFELTNDNPDQEAGICGGTTRILIEPYTPSLRDLWVAADLEDVHESGIIVITEVAGSDAPQVRRYLTTSDSGVINYPETLQESVAQVWHRGESRSVSTPAGFYLIQLMRPFPILHIFGAGHVGRAVAQLAHLIDWDVIVYDDREDHANREYFPHARRIVVKPFADILDGAQIASLDCAVVTTRGHRGDLQLLRQLLTMEIRYLGLMSSQRKWSVLSNVLKEEGYAQEIIDTVHAPVGLEIASETVPEIAVSIVAQIIQTMRTATD
jgi:xanthine dehydrogenase accessory factor